MRRRRAHYDVTVMSVVGFTVVSHTPVRSRFTSSPLTQLPHGFNMAGGDALEHNTGDLSFGKYMVSHYSYVSVLGSLCHEIRETRILHIL